MNGSARGSLVLSLFNQYYERVYWFARRSVDAPTAEDVAQEVFVRLMRIPDLEDRVVTISYLIKVADNLIKRRHKQLRQHERFATRSASDDRVDQATHEGDPECQRALGRLSSTEHAALRMIVCEGLSYEAAALALDVKVSTVNNWKFRGIQKLRDVTETRHGTLAG
jgi:RNA polymerase sigma-70 factor (ECF subfamily)